MTEITPAPAGGNQPLTTIGDIGVSYESVFVHGSLFPIKGTVWTMSDATQQSSSSSGLAVVPAIGLAVIVLCCGGPIFAIGGGFVVPVVGFAAGIGLTIALAVGVVWLASQAKTKRASGHVQVTVQGTNLHYTTTVQATTPGTLAQITEQVNWARRVAAAAK